MHLKEDTIKSELIFDGKVVKLYKDEALLENGCTVSRELIKHPGGYAFYRLTRMVMFT